MTETPSTARDMSDQELLREASKPPKMVIGFSVAGIISMIVVGVQMGRFISAQDGTQLHLGQVVKSVDGLEERMRSVETSVAILLDRREQESDVK